MRSFFLKIKGSMALIVLVAAFLGSAVMIATTREKEHPPDTIVIRFGHWQLEPGFREALKEIIAEYEKLHPSVKIVVDSIPESTYAQWVTTQLMGRTAPDLLEVGMLGRQIWLSYFPRYFVSLSTAAGEPNPYNKGTDLEGVPYRSTFKDGMLMGYYEELQEIMVAPISQHSMRIFYNKDLLKKLTGLDKPPEEYREFLAICEKIAAQTNPTNGKPYIPIAGQMGAWESRLVDPMTFTAVQKADYSGDGRVSADEIFLAFRAGKVDLSYEPFRKRLQMLREVTKYLPNGYIGLQRNEGVFMFIQQQAVFISTGTWEAGGLRLQSEGQFELGVAGFPSPRKDDPEYGNLAPGPLYEAATVSCPFAINRASKHPDIALDFLLFITSQKMNERFNERASWIPSIVGAETVGFMKQFEPRFEGVYAGVAQFLFFGAETQVRWAQQYSSFQARKRLQDPAQDFEEGLAALRQNYEPFYLESGMKDFEEYIRNVRRGLERHEHLVAGVRGRALTLKETNPEDSWVKYRVLVRNRQLSMDASNAVKIAIAERRRPFPSTYQYTPEALERLKKDLARKSKTGNAQPDTTGTLDGGSRPAIESTQQP